jgi:hypothetical protein
MTGAFGCDCSNRRKREADAEDAARQIPRYGQGIPVGSTQSASHNSILPWRPRRSRPIPNTHRTKTPNENLAINAIPIADEIAWPLLPAVSLHQLPTYPFRTGMRGRCQTQDFAAPMLQNQQPIQELK